MNLISPETIMLPDNENDIIVHFFLTRYWRVTDGETDRQTDRNPIAEDSAQHCGARCKNCRW